MTLEEEINWYMACLRRRTQLAKLERMASNPTLAQKRKVRPRLGLARRIILTITRAFE